ANHLLHHALNEDAVADVADVVGGLGGGCRPDNGAGHLSVSAPHCRAAPGIGLCRCCILAHGLVMSSGMIVLFWPLGKPGGLSHSWRIKKHQTTSRSSRARWSNWPGLPLMISPYTSITIGANCAATRPIPFTSECVQ